MTDTVVFVAEAGKEAGLGHIGRSSAVAVALRCRGIQTVCYGLGLDSMLELDGIVWMPVDEKKAFPPEAHVLVIDSYRLTQEDLRRAAAASRLVAMHDYGGAPDGAALVVSVAAPSSSPFGWLTGPAYAALRPWFWGLPERRVNESVRRVLVTTGSGQFAELGRTVSEALALAIADITVALVHGPHAAAHGSDVVETIVAPESLVDPLLASDVIVSSGGQTMLEAVATGTPCIALPLVDNQRRQVALLESVGAVRVVDPPDALAVAAAVAVLAGDREGRQTLSASGQRAVDGYGALRIAFQIAQLVRTGS